MVVLTRPWREGPKSVAEVVGPKLLNAPGLCTRETILGGPETIGVVKKNRNNFLEAGVHTA